MHDSHAVYQSWHDFISGRQLKHGAVSDYVLRSWQISAQHGVDPLHLSVPEVLNETELQKEQHKHSALIQAAQPIMRMTEISTRTTSSITLLTSAEGVLLDVAGDNAGLTTEEKRYNKPGCLCSIEKMGGRAISMCLLENRPLSICGPEHYCRYFHKSSCYAAPIHGENGKAVGAISVSGWTSDWHPHTLALVAAAAETISTRLREATLSYNQKRLNSMLSSVYDSLPEAILALDMTGHITHANSKAAGLLHMSPSQLRGKSFGDLLHQKDAKEIISLLKEGRRASCDIRLTEDDEQMSLCRIEPTVLPTGEHVGMTLTIISHNQLINMAAQVGGNFAVYDFHHIIGESRALRDCIELARKVAGTSSRILLTGESGTGKELFAQAIHNNSRVRNGPFVAISCAAIPRDLIEAELFGYVSGAFTGARKSGAPGKFALASEGTLFLDEVNSLPLDMQAKLLRALQQGEILRIGANKPTPVKTRIIAATNKDLMTAVQENTFREDLYYRLDVVEITIPPLRERKDDIPRLVQHIIKSLCNKMQLPPARILDEFYTSLASYKWPGNIRELYNICERALILADGEALSPQHLPGHIAPNVARKSVGSVGTLEDNFFRLLKQAIAAHNGNMTLVAKELGISRSTLYRKMKKLST